MARLLRWTLGMEDLPMTATRLLAYLSIATLSLLVGCGMASGEPSAYSYYPGAESGGVRDSSSSGDRYEDVGTNPFVETSHDPFSTFAADVDTASYDIFVRDVEDGMLPQPLSVRLEEYVNFFQYDYPAPPADAAVPFDISLAAAAHPMGRQIAQLRVGIQASEPPVFQKRPMNLVFLVDTSGSMRDADKLPLVRYLLQETLLVLDGSDTVSIVTYSGTVAVRLSPTAVTDSRSINIAINGLSAGGGTAGGDGIRLAYAQAEAGFVEGGINHVVLCTDGDFNIGISDPDQLVALIEEERRGGVTLTAIGFGRGNLNDAMMERVSNAGNGIYSVLSSEEQATRYAEDQILRTIRHVAKDMKIQVEFNAEHVQAYRLLGYENRAIADVDFRNDVVDAGEVGAGHRVTALYELVLAGQTIPNLEGAPTPESGEPVLGEREIDAAELVRVKVRWKEVGATEEDSAHEVAESLRPAEVAQLADSAERDLQWASAIAAFAEILKGSPYANLEDLDRIESIVSAQADRDDDRARFFGLFGEARSLLE